MILGLLDDPRLLCCHFSVCILNKLMLIPFMDGYSVSVFYFDRGLHHSRLGIKFLPVCPVPGVNREDVLLS